MRHNFVSSSQVICGLWVIPGRRAPLISGFSQRIQSHTQWRYNTNKIINLCWSRTDVVSEGAEMPVRGVDPKADSRDRQVCEKTKLYLTWGLWCWIFSWSKSLWHGFNWKQRERTVNTGWQKVSHGKGGGSMEENISLNLVTTLSERRLYKWRLESKGTIILKEESRCAWLACMTSEAADGSPNGMKLWLKDSVGFLQTIRQLSSTDTVESGSGTLRTLWEMLHEGWGFELSE